MNRLLPPSSRRARSALLASLLCALAPLASAGEHDPQTPAHDTQDSAFAAPLAVDALEALRGGDQSASIVDIHGTVEGNSAQDIVSGDNAVQGGAFGNAAGINTLIQNTGSNVLIQNGMTVNVQFADPGMP